MVLLTHFCLLVIQDPENWCFLACFVVNSKPVYVVSSSKNIPSKSVKIFRWFTILPQFVILHFGFLCVKFQPSSFNYVRGVKTIFNLFYRWGVKYHFMAEVTEKDTNVKINTGAPAVAITRNPIKLEIVEMKSGYKPYIPSQKLKIKATTSELKFISVLVFFLFSNYFHLLLFCLILSSDIYHICICIFFRLTFLVHFHLFGAIIQFLPSDSFLGAP